MALVLFLVFNSRWRLLPLVIALIAAAIAFGLLALVGGSLTMASIAALPILIGLAVDYAIQFQARSAETGSVVEGATRSGPTIAAACTATAAGFLALQLSPSPDGSRLRLGPHPRHRDRLRPRSDGGAGGVDAPRAGGG